MDELDVEADMSRGEVAAFFREIADKLEGQWSGGDRAVDEGSAVGGADERAGGPAEHSGVADATRSGDEMAAGTGSLETMTVIVGGESATVILPERMAVDVEVGSRSGLLESGVEQHMAFELVWEIEEIPEDDSIEVV